MEETKPSSRTSHYESQRFKNTTLASIGLIILITLAFSFRWYYHWQVGGLSPYLQWAQKNYYGDVAIYYIQWAHALFTGTQSHTAIEAPPGYAIFIALLQHMGVTTITDLRLAQGLIDSFAIIPLYLILRWAGAKRLSSLVACLFYAIFPAIAVGSTLIHPEWSSATFLLWSLYLLICINNKTSHTTAIVTSLILGTFIAIAFLFNYNFAILSILCLLWLLFRIKGYRKLSVIFCFLLGVITIFSFWLNYNNALYFDGYIPRIHHQTSSSIKPINLEENIIEDLLIGNKEEINRYFQYWYDVPITMMSEVLNRWRSIIFDSTQIPGSHIYFYWLAFFIDRFGILIFLLGLWLTRAKGRVVYIMSVPMIQGLLSTGFLQRQLFYIDYILISYFLALTLVIHQSWQYVDKHPTKLYKKIFITISIFFVAYLVFWSYKIGNDFFKLIHHPRFS